MIRTQPHRGGWLEVVCGPMFSGKSEELIRRLRRAEIAGQTMLVARDEVSGAIVGTATFIRYRVSSGLKGRLEDVIVDSSARGQGVGEALVLDVLRRANDARVLMLELNSMPYRESANRLYKRLGFVRRPTNVYVWWPR